MNKITKALIGFFFIVVLCFIFILKLSSELAPSIISFSVFSVIIWCLYLFLPKDEEFIKNVFIAIGIGVTITGWLVVSYLNNQQEITQKKRDLRVKYLLDAYFRLENSDHRNFDSPTNGYIYMKYAESALTSIQLLGEPETIQLANKYILTGGDHYSDLLQALRNNLRKELNLSILPLSNESDSSYHPSSYRIKRKWGVDDTLTSAEHVQLIIKLNELNK